MPGNPNQWLSPTEIEEEKEIARMTGTKSRHTSLHFQMKPKSSEETMPMPDVCPSQGFH